MKPILWVVGKYNGTIQLWNESHTAWELQGIFDNLNDAENACISEQYFVVPMNLNELLPYEKIIWPGLYFPKQNDIN